MTYRDDREALHHRVAQLEQELDDARREGKQEGRDEVQAHTAGLQQKLGEMRGELERMEAELQAMRGQAPAHKWATSGSPASRIAPIVAALVLAAGAGALFFVRSGGKPSPRAAPLPSPPAIEAPTPPAAPETAVPIPTEPIVPPTPPSPPRSTTARWTATVTRADGLPLAPGAACAIEATITTTETNAIVRALSVACGAHKLYRSTDSLNGMAQMSNDARETLGAADDKSTFTMAYRDIGSRTGERTQIDLDTKLRLGAVFRETLPRFRVELSVPSASGPTTPLADADHRLRRTGKIVEVSGATALKSGASCALRAMPTGKGRGCVAEVACGTNVLWPSSAPVTCTYEGGRPTGVTADEGPTSLALDGETLTLKTKALGATIAFDPPGQ